MILALIACVGSTGGTRTEKPGAEGDTGTDGVRGWTDDLDAETSTLTSDRDGYVEIPVEVAEGDVFQVVLTRDHAKVDVEQVYDPDGNLVLDWQTLYNSQRSLTECIYPSKHAVTLNWPIRDVDGPLTPGTWTVYGATIDQYGNYDAQQDLTVEVLKRNDADLAVGRLHAVVAYAEGVGDDPDVVDAVERAAEYWKQLYGAIGVTLDVAYTDLAVDPALPAPYDGLDEIDALLEGEPARTVLVLVGETVEDDETLYGEAAAIPGPFAPTPISVVEVGWLANAGANAEFSDDEVLLMGETMAHEVGHYLGLFHPVEDGGYGAWQYWDALDDTEECDSWRSCENDLGANLMFPYPVCETARSCTRQSEITEDQAGVVNRYVGVE